MNKYIAIDLGGTNMRAAIVNEDGSLLDVLKTTTDTDKSSEHTINKLIKLIEQLDDFESCIGIGVGCPGPLNPKEGLILSPTNFPHWKRVPLVQILSDYFGKPAFLNNDANVAGLAEALVGSGKNLEIVQYITVSTGIGGGLVINGKVIDGATFNASEIGNVIVDRNDSFKHHFLNQGAVEAIASGTALTRIANDNGIPAKDAGDLFKSDTIDAAKIIENAADNIARLMGTISHVVDPNVFVFGGTVITKNDDFFNLIKSKYENYIYPQMHGKVKIKKAQLDEPGLVGAAMLVHSKLK